jgi:hypothetical protein
MGKERIKLALELAGNEHTFQKTLVLLICVAWMSINFVLLVSTLIYMTLCSSVAVMRRLSILKVMCVTKKLIVIYVIL